MATRNDPSSNGAGPARKRPARCGGLVLTTGFQMENPPPCCGEGFMVVGQSASNWSPYASANRKARQLAELGVDEGDVVTA
jgi:hypothetical protein